MEKAKRLNEIIKQIAHENNLSIEKVRNLFNSLNKTILSELKTSGEFNLFGLGKLVVTHHKSRNGINPFTKKPISVPAKNVVKIRAGKMLKEAI